MLNSNHVPYGALYSFEHEYMKQLSHDESGYGDEHVAQTSSAWEEVCAYMKSVFKKP